mmetsp:Transcript_2465/g.7024  ORF Transcript_2465/g.7024 Transcript_2465/m.7024 type:complete len:225 (-) Transcript_2465:391-1065(-)
MAPTCMGPSSCASAQWARMAGRASLLPPSSCTRAGSPSPGRSALSSTLSGCRLRSCSPTGIQGPLARSQTYSRMRSTSSASGTWATTLRSTSAMSSAESNPPSTRRRSICGGGLRRRRTSGSGTPLTMTSTPSSSSCSLHRRPRRLRRRSSPPLWTGSRICATRSRSGPPDSRGLSSHMACTRLSVARPFTVLPRLSSTAASSSSLSSSRSLSTLPWTSTSSTT